MIYDSSSFSFTPYHDSRGTHGISGPLLLAKDRKSGIQYLVKHTIRNDIGNEYLAHKLAIALNVPTTEAILIGQSPQFNLPYAVGIEYAEDFKRFNADRLIGNTQKDGDGVGTAIMSGDKDAEVPAPPKEPEYQDSDPFVTTLMRHMAFRYIINLDNNLQFATHDGKLIAFDFADSFTQNTSDMLEAIPNLV